MRGSSRIIAVIVLLVAGAATLAGCTGPTDTSPQPKVQTYSWADDDDWVYAHIVPTSNLSINLIFNGTAKTRDWPEDPPANARLPSGDEGFEEAMYFILVADKGEGPYFAKFRGQTMIHAARHGEVFVNLGASGQDQQIAPPSPFSYGRDGSALAIDEYEMTLRGAPATYHFFIMNSGNLHRSMNFSVLGDALVTVQSGRSSPVNVPSWVISGGEQATIRTRHQLLEDELPNGRQIIRDATHPFSIQGTALLKSIPRMPLPPSGRTEALAFGYTLPDGSATRVEYIPGMPESEDESWIREGIQPLSTGWLALGPPGDYVWSIHEADCQYDGWSPNCAVDLLYWDLPIRFVG